jgi:HAD superfamily phosphatase
MVVNRAFQALLLDMDGVLAEVSMSYRKAIVDTAKHFGVDVTSEDIEAQKLAGNANNDWQLTLKLILMKNPNSSATINKVTKVFEDLYQGKDGKPGLCLLETLIVPKGLLRELHRRLPKGMAIVTGRPRKDCVKFLQTHGIEDLFPIQICMEDCPPKPSSEPIQLALKGLNVAPEDAAMIGDTVDDIVAAVKADSYAFGVLTPQVYAKAILAQKAPVLEKVLEQAGASMVLQPGLAELLDIIQPLSISTPISSGKREASVSRITKETSIDVFIDLDGKGESKVSTRVVLWI